MQFLRRAWHLIRQRRRDADLAEEMAFHREMKEREFRTRGASPTEAALATRRALGSVALAQDHARDVWIPRWLQGLGQDFRLAVRTLRATPVVTAVAVLSLALGIGANTAIFSLVNSLMLRTLPGVVEPERLVTLASGDTSQYVGAPRWSYAFWKEIEQRASPFGGAFAWSASRFSLSTPDGMESVDGIFASGEFFKALGVPAVMGRTLTTQDDVPGSTASNQVAVISYDFWQRHFGGLPQAVGTSLTIEQMPFTIIGVTPAGFIGTEVGRAFDVALPLAAEPVIRGTNSFLRAPYDRFNYWLVVGLRLKPEQSIATATALLRGVQPQVRDAAMPRLAESRWFDDFLKVPFTVSVLGTGISPLRSTYRRPLLTILFVVALVLLVACANIASLQIARASARQHELSVRRALGATPSRLARQLLVESLLLASVGAATGLLVASWAGRMLVAQISTQANPIALVLPLDSRVLAFTMALTVTTAVLFGIAPAFRAAKVSPLDAIKSQARGLVGEGPAGWSAALVVSQVMLSLVLVVLAELLIGTLERMATRPLGFDSNRVLLARADSSRTRVKAAERGTFFQRLVDAAGSLPGVTEVAASMWTPVDRSNWSIFVHPTGIPREPASDRISAKYNFVSPGWFGTYGIPLRAGRDIDAHDVHGALPVAVVNEAFVRRFLAGRPPLASTVDLTLGPHNEYAVGTKTIVGVVGDAIYQSLREETPPTAFFPLAQWDMPIPLPSTIALSIRPVAGSPATLTPRINNALSAVDKALTVRFQTLDVQVNDSFRQERLVAMLSGFFGALALLLAGLGLYGVTAYGVARRRGEIGIRMALGAAPASVVRLVLSRIARLVGLGVIIGTVASLWLSRFVSALLYGVQPRDPVTLVGAIVVLGTVAALAGWVPAWRASRIDPAAVLREQ